MLFSKVFIATKKIIYFTVFIAAFSLIASCTTLKKHSSYKKYDVSAIDANSVTPPLARYEGLNEKRDPITRIKLGLDVLVPQPLKEDSLPYDIVGPYELRGETLANALQLILDGYDMSIAFETNAGFKNRITVSNLRGELKDVIDRVCSLANLYCHFESGNLTVKEEETFVVDLPPIGKLSNTVVSGMNGKGNRIDSVTNSAYEQIAKGLEAVIGKKPTVDASTHVMIYTANQRTNKYAKEYFKRLRKNTALIVFETNIWEVTLNEKNHNGINWNQLQEDSNIEDLNNSSNISSYTGSGNFSTDNIRKFIAERGDVKTISQPQITVLSGSSASLSISQKENFVSGISRTLGVNGRGDTLSTQTGTVNTGLTMTINSAWDHSTVYGDLNIVLDDLLHIKNFKPDSETTIQLPQTTQRSLQTEVRVRPGDAILIGGLVSEKEDFSNKEENSKSNYFRSPERVNKKNTELVFLLRPRVVIFVDGDIEDTPEIVDAPKEGVAIRTPIPSNITDSVKNLFSDKDNTIYNMSSKIKNLFKKNKKDDTAIAYNDKNYNPISKKKTGFFGLFKTMKSNQIYKGQKPRVEAAVEKKKTGFFSLFKTMKPKQKSRIEDPLVEIVLLKKLSSKEEDNNPFGKPVASLRDLLNSPDAVSVGAY